MRGVRQLLFGGVTGKVVGVLRELLLAALYGTTGPASAYRIAQTATLIPINFLTSDALSAGFLPNHSRLLRENPGLAYLFYRIVNRLIFGISMMLAVLLVIGRTKWVGLLAPGLDESTSHLAASMLLVMAIGVPFYLSTAMGSYLQMSHGKFILASSRATLQSIGLIAGTISGYVLERPTLLAWGFTAAYLVLAIWTWLSIRTIRADGERLVPVGAELRPLLALFARSMRPMLFVPLALQGSYAVERLTASLISNSAVSAVDYARLITDTAVVLVAAPLGIAVLANLPGMATEQSTEVLRDLVGRCMLIFVPASVLVIGLALPITQVLFERGAFGEESTKTTASILTGLGFGLWAQVVSYVLVKGLSAIGRNGAAAATVATGCAVMVAVNLLLFRHLGPITLGIAAAAGAAVQVCLATAMHGIWPDFMFQLLRFAPPTFLCLAVFVILVGLSSGGIMQLGNVEIRAASVIPMILCLMAIPSFRRDILALAGTRKP